jgi:hypothetical protein
MEYVAIKRTEALPPSFLALAGSAFLNVVKRVYHTVVSALKRVEQVSYLLLQDHHPAIHRTLSGVWPSPGKVPLPGFFESERPEMNTPVAAFTLALSVIHSFRRLFHAKEFRLHGQPTIRGRAMPR